MCLYLLHSLISAERGAALRSSDFPRMKGYRGWWAFAQDYMFEDEQNTSTLQQPLLPNWQNGSFWCLRSLVWTELNGPTAKKVETPTPPEHSESNPLCVNLGIKHLESVQREKARRAFSTCAMWLQIHSMHWKGCGFLLRYSESYDERQRGLRSTSGYLACLVILSQL